MRNIVAVLKEYTEAREKLLKNRSAWFYNILIAASALLGSLIALTNNSLESFCVRALFVLTLALITLGILSAAIALHYDRVCSKRHCREVRNQIRRIRDKIEETDEFYTAINDPTKFLIFDILAYIFFSFSFVSLMLYVIVKNLPELF